MVSFHIEPTSKCTLECPLCDRTWFYETFKRRNLHEVNIDHLVNFIGVNAEIAEDKSLLALSIAILEAFINSSFFKIFFNKSPNV